MPFPPNTASLTLLTPPTVEPLALADAKNYLRLESDADDALVADLIVAARMESEQQTCRSFLLQTWELTLDYLPFTFGGPSPLGFALGGFALAGFGPCGDGSIRLPRPPLIAVQSINYISQEGVESAYDLDDLVTSPGTPGRIAPTWGSLFPFSLPQIAAVTITYTAGYGDDPAAVPRVVVAAMRLLVAHYWACRVEDQPEPAAINNLLSPLVWPAYA